MKRITGSSLMSLLFHLVAAQEAVPGHLQYDEVCYLTSHNSYAATDHGYRYAQQRLTIEQQLEYGVRALMLDIGLDKNQIVLIHKNPFLTRLICAGKDPMPFQEALSTIKSFLERYPTEVITIFLENYVQEEYLLDAAVTQAQLTELIISPNDWDPLQREGWPTFDWMRSTNKRLIIFNCLGRTTWCFNQWEHVVENRWSTLHPARACSERTESKAYRGHQRSLYLLNYFPFLNFNGEKSYETINSQKLTTFLKKALSQGLTTGSQHPILPTFLSIDFVEKGDGYKQVALLNFLKRGTIDPAQTNHHDYLSTAIGGLLTNRLISHILEACTVLKGDNLHEKVDRYSEHFCFFNSFTSSSRGNGSF